MFTFEYIRACLRRLLQTHSESAAYGPDSADACREFAMESATGSAGFTVTETRKSVAVWFKIPKESGANTVRTGFGMHEEATTFNLDLAYDT